jgi:hypothetical protein
MMPRLPFVVLIAVCLSPTVRGADELDGLLRDLRVAKPQAANSPAARAAWERLVRRGPEVLPRLLRAMDMPDTVAANWLRTAFDEIAGRALKAGGKGIDADALLAFAKDTKRQGRARRLALSVVKRLRPGTHKRLVGDALGDPEFNYDAVEVGLAELKNTKGLPRPTAIVLYRRILSATRDLDQARAVTTRLRDLGDNVSLADHFGFLCDWYAIGPFDAKGGKGFKAVYPPERGVDLDATAEGKGGKKLRWRRYTVPETPTGRFPILVDLRQPLGEAEDAVAYAYTAFTVDKPRTVEFRGAADDNFTVWVNGARAFGFEEYRNGVRLDRHRFKVELRSGRNTVLVKVCQAPHDPDSPDPNWEFLLRLTDSAGRGVVFPSALKPAK